MFNEISAYIYKISANILYNFIVYFMKFELIFHEIVKYILWNIDKCFMKLQSYFS